MTASGARVLATPLLDYLRTEGIEAEVFAEAVGLPLGTVLFARITPAQWDGYEARYRAARGA
ncbi:hypothetical protein [Cellulosimicrobium sp. TH-20]|uniref:hypothetical protein n=1 Tax=Cellulosimicrobium sp. TH-20 TaxID=1980001 RepID=UPI0011A6DAF3|nr:hypothetical protein [Cellulosimicrobium sp. TH-20]